MPYTHDDAYLHDGAYLTGESTTPTGAQYYTNFDEYTAGDLLSDLDWTSQFRAAQEIEVQDVSGDLIGHVHHIQGTAGRDAISWDDVGLAEDVEVYMHLNANTNTDTRAFLRGGGEPGNETGYAAGYREDQGLIMITRYDGGSATDLASQALTGTGAYKQRVRVSGNTISVKVWPAENAEPSAWDLQYTDGTPITGNGWAGIFSFPYLSWQLYEFGVGTGGAEAPVGNVTAPEPEPTSDWTEITDFNEADWGPWSGATGRYNFVTSPVFEGNRAMQVRPSTSNDAIYSTSGLPGYFPKGNIARYFIRTNSTSGTCRARTYFGYDTVNTQEHRYQIQLNLHERDNWYLFAYDGGSLDRLDATTNSNFTFQANTWYEVRIIWDDGTLGGSNNDITIELRRAGNDDVLDRLTANDSRHAGKTGIGMNAATGSGVRVTWDNFQRKR